jgi:hypothetical protein
MSEVAVMRIALVNAPLVSAIGNHGVGHQMPPVLLMVGRRRAARPGLRAPQGPRRAALDPRVGGTAGSGPAGERRPGHREPILAGRTPYAPRDFWVKAVGVVTPHRAQQGLIVQRLHDLFRPTGVELGLVRGAVDTVERFQGQQWEVIIAMFTLGDLDAIRDEDEFLMSLNRFNVMASRARAKLIVLVTQEVVDHLASDIDVLRESRLVKSYVESFCKTSRPMTLS